MSSARDIAWKALQRWEDSAVLADALVESDIRSCLAGPDADLAVEIFYGAIRWRARLEFVIQNSSFKIKDDSLRTLLHCALYQLLFLDRVPDYAVVNEAVELAPDRAKKFTNAFLRGFLRDREGWQKRLEETRESQPEVYYSHPRWLVERWEKFAGAPRTRRLLEWNNTIAPLFIRVNTLKTSTESLMPRLESHFPKLASNPLAVEIGKPAGLFRNPAFLEGGFYAQDPSTLNSVELLDPKPGEKVLDVCSAPGGKTTYIAQRMKNEGLVVATDLDPKRLRLVEENCERLGASCVRTTPLESVRKSRDKYDRILLDVPCSNTGVLRRRVDLRWRLKEKDIAALSQRQVDLCKEYAVRLAPRGVLVYSTCSLEPEENEGVVSRVCKAVRGLSMMDSWKSLPPESGMDGAFAAKLQFTH